MSVSSLWTTPWAVVCIAACMAGAVCGDHCSPISDTTIMASAGAQCDHVQHVSTQLPYAITVAAVSFVSYVIAGFSARRGLPSIAIVLMLLTLFGIHMVHKRNKTVVSSSGIVWVVNRFFVRQEGKRA